MRKIAANRVYPVSGPPIKNGIITLTDEGEILDVSSGGESITETANLEFYNGILVPGFINSHCHLELSHLKNRIPPGEGLTAFIKQIPAIRNQKPETIEPEAEKAMRNQWNRGIQAVGDIVNTTDTITVKQHSPVTSVNFIELFNKSTIPVDQLMNEGKQLINLFWNSQAAFFSPHSFYGTSSGLISAMLDEQVPEAILSIHFKESEFEGDVKYKTSLKRIFESKKVKNLLLVHNLRVEPQDVEWIVNEKSKSSVDIFFILCPNSNLYIEQQLPPVLELVKSNVPICLGTDSLASNNQLSILDEMKTIQQHVPEIPFNEVLQWATLNGAKALKVDDRLGSFEKNKKPGVLLISGFNFKTKMLLPQAEVTRLV